MSGGKLLDLRLHEACKDDPFDPRDNDDVIYLITQEKCPVNLPDIDRRTPLHIAAINDHIAAAIALLDHGAAIQPSDDTGNTPLHYSAQRDKVEVTRLLLTRGASLLLPNDSSYTPLHVAVSLGRTDQLDVMLAHGADINITTKRGQNALFLSRTRAVTEYLLDKGANRWHKDSHRRNALDDVRMTGANKRAGVPETLETYVPKWSPQRHGRFSIGMRSSVRALVLLRTRGLHEAEANAAEPAAAASSSGSHLWADMPIEVVLLVCEMLGRLPDPSRAIVDPLATPVLNRSGSSELSLDVPISSPPLALKDGATERLPLRMVGRRRQK